MPSPIAHALGGLSIGWLAARPPLPVPAAPTGHVAAAARRSRWPRPLLLVAAGVSADLDLLSHAHHAASHSLCAAALVGLAALAIGGPRRWRLAAALSAAYASHVLFDYLAEDSSPPIGIMAWWPFSDEYFVSPFYVFLGISRQYWNPLAWVQNAASVTVEVILLLPFLLAACRLRGCPLERHDLTMIPAALRERAMALSAHVRRAPGTQRK